MNLIAALIIAHVGVGPTVGPAAAESARARPWGVETGVLWPAIVQIIAPKVTRTLWARRTFSGDLGAAPVFRIPIDRAGEGRLFEVGGALIYRQFFWRGLNLELGSYLLRAQMDSSVDGNRYVGFNFFGTAEVGWRVDFWLHRVTFYVLPQLGVGGDLVRSNPWPAPEGPQPIFVGELLLGFRF